MNDVDDVEITLKIQPSTNKHIKFDDEYLFHWASCLELKSLMS